MSPDSDRAVPSPSDVVAAYGAAWHESDEQARRALLEVAWASDGVYIDPTVLVRGREQLVAHLAGFQQRMPGHSLVRTTRIDEHHGRLRFGWRMLDPDGAGVLDGMDYGELDDDGRLRRIAGFFGPPSDA